LSSSCCCGKLPPADARIAEALNEDQETGSDGKLDGHVKHASRKGAGFQFQAAIPFPFVVGKQTLPAGTYVVQRFLGKPKKASDMGVVVMKASEHHIYKVIITASGEKSRVASATGSRLIFTSFKGQQYLNRVCIAGDAVVRELSNLPSEVATRGSSGEVIVTGFDNAKEN
jgi:hypothetical protein